MHILLILLLIIVLIYFYNNTYYPEKFENVENVENVQTIKIDKIEIIKRTPEYQVLIDKLINDKKQLFTKEEIEVMKNKFQFYNTEYGIDNISDEILKTFKNNDFDNNVNNYIGNDIDNNIYIQETIYDNPAYNSILKNIGSDYNSSCLDVEVLKNNDYLKNYYYDMNANKVKSNLKDYINDYQIQIDKNYGVCQKVDTVKTNSGFIIPDQYAILKNQTNAYNIDWSRIQNPLTIY